MTNFHIVTGLEDGGAQIQIFCLLEGSKIQSIYLSGECYLSKDSFYDSKCNLNQNSLSFKWSQVGSHGVEAAWAGGRNGREVMDRFFPLAPDLLSPRGLFYLVTIKENNPGNPDQFIF